MGPAAVHFQQLLHSPKLGIDQAVTTPERLFRFNDGHPLIGFQKRGDIGGELGSRSFIHMDHIAVSRRINGLKHPSELFGKAVEKDEIRSEENTSELQSLMRLSYAGFCLK